MSKPSQARRQSVRYPQDHSWFAVVAKYAVRCGGGHLHRWGLADALLVKDNHIAGLSPSDYARRIRSAVEDLRARNTPLRFVCAEADTMEQFEALLSLPDETLTIALLDNFSLDSLKHAVELRNRLRPSMLLEASGGVAWKQSGLSREQELTASLLAH